jgi:pre-mRNA-splicing factor SYF1
MILLLFRFCQSLEIVSSSLKILQLTDLHYGEGEIQDSLNTNAIENQLRWEDPDIVVVTGDLVSGYAWPGTEGWFNQSYQKFIKPLKKFKKPWALVLGNHDIEADLSGNEILKLEEFEALSLSHKEISSLSHSSNYYVPITHKGELKLVLWALDTGNRNHLEFGYDKIHQDQLEWVRSTQEAFKISSGKEIPGMVFVHIPPPEFMDLWPVSKGHRFEDVACPGDHSRYVLEGLDHVLAFVAGHDHFNDYEGKLGNFSLFYGRKTGYAGVGPEPYFNKGARVFQVFFENFRVDSWIREETGEVVRLKERKGNMEVQVVCAESQPTNYLFLLVVPFVGLTCIALGFIRKKEKPLRFTL